MLQVRKSLIFNLLILSVSAASFMACGRKHTETSAQEAPPRFTLSDTMLAGSTMAQVKMMPVTGELNFFGKIQADANTVVKVFPLVGGTIRSVHAELGDFVTKGQVLATIRSGEVADLQRQLADAKSDLALAQKNLKIAEELFSSKLNADRDVVAAKKEVEKADAELRRINEVHQIYGLGNSENYEIRAPISGFIVAKNINADMPLRSDRSEEVFSIAQIDEVWAVASVNESDISKISVGMPVDIKVVSYPGRIFQGKVDKVFNFLDPETKTMKVKAQINNPGYLLKPEMNATLSIKVDENTQALAIPSSAIIYENGHRYVMVYKDKTNVMAKEVTVRSTSGNIAFIDAGLHEGEKVFTSNQLLIYAALNN